MLRKLLLSWKPTHECNCTFFDLFERGPEGLEVLPLVLDDGEAGIRAVKEMAAESGLTYEFISPESLNRKAAVAATLNGSAPPADIDFFWPGEVFDSIIDVVHTSYDGVLTSHNVR